MIVVDMPRKQYSPSDEQLELVEKLFREKRIAAGYRVQEDAATALDVSQELISRTERSFSLHMQIGHIGWIMQNYGIVPNDLFALLGMFTPPVAAVGEREYIREEILPTLGKLSPQSLRTLKRIAESFIEEDRRTYTEVRVDMLLPGDIILWEGAERRVVHVAAEDGRVVLVLGSRTPGESRLIPLDPDTPVERLQK